MIDDTHPDEKQKEFSILSQKVWYLRRIYDIIFRVNRFRHSGDKADKKGGACGCHYKMKNWKSFRH